MGLALIVIIFAAVAALAFFVIGRTRALTLLGQSGQDFHSKPGYHGAYLAIIGVGPALIVWLAWSGIYRWFSDSYVSAQLGADFTAIPMAERSSFLRGVQNLVDGASFGEVSPLMERGAEVLSSFSGLGTMITGALCLGMGIAGLVYGLRRIAPQLRARHTVEASAMGMLIAASVVAILTTVGIVLSLVFESLRFFEKVPFFSFLFGTNWSPQSAFEGAGAAASSRNAEVFGAVPVFAGTLLITLIAISVAAPIGLMAAIYLSDYASPRVRGIVKPLLEILAGIPTVVYGFFAALTVAPFLRSSGSLFGLGVSSESALAAGLVMGVMIIPFVSSLSDDVLNAVPQSLRDGSASLGATKSETIRRVILPAALPGVVSALMLAISRAIGETMIVVMAAGLAANLTGNPLEAVTTVTVQIVTLLVGDQEFDSAKTLAAFALGLVLFCITLLLNIIALGVIRKYQEQYD